MCDVSIPAFPPAALCSVAAGPTPGPTEDGHFYCAAGVQGRGGLSHSAGTGAVSPHPSLV